jgi:hypothetical protein
MHLGKGNKQQVHSIQHQLDAHENDDHIATGEHTNDADNEEGYG